MSRLIDADLAAKKIIALAKEPDYQHEDEDWRAGLHMAADVLDEVPTAAEVEEAKWIPVSTKPGVYAGMKCSLCKARISYSEFYGGNHNYCHKCGAKMTSED